MRMETWRRVLVWLMVILAFACGIIGLLVGFLEKEWMLGITGWFTGGTLLAVMRMALMADEFMESRRRDRKR